MSLSIAIRPPVEGDVALILNSWLKSYRNSESVRSVTNDVYFSEECGQKARILNLLGEANTLVACDTEDKEIVYGWACFDVLAEGLPSVVHYCYTKQAYRRQGIARALLKNAGVVGVAPFLATHETKLARDIRGKSAMYVFNPYWEMFTERLVDYAQN